MEPIKRTYSVKVLLIQEDNLWSMQCLDYDLAAQGRTQEEVKDAFGKIFLGQIVIDIREGREPFENIGKAPQEFWDMFK